MEKPVFSKWSCFICGDIVVEGQRFVWMPGRGYAHIECFTSLVKSRTGGSIPGDIAAMLEVEEVLAYSIVRLKQARWLALSEEVRREIDEERKKLEGLAARSSKMLSEILSRHGVEV